MTCAWCGLLLTLLAAQYEPPKKDALTIKVTGYQWYWGYAYPDQGIGEYVSKILTEDQAKAAGEPEATRDVFFSMGEIKLAGNDPAQAADARKIYLVSLAEPPAATFENPAQLGNAKAIENDIFGLQQFVIGKPIWETYLKGEESDPKVAMQKTMEAVQAEINRGDKIA